MLLLGQSSALRDVQGLRGGQWLSLAQQSAVMAATTFCKRKDPISIQTTAWVPLMILFIVGVFRMSWSSLSHSSRLKRIKTARRARESYCKKKMALSCEASVAVAQTAVSWVSPCLVTG